MPRTFKTRRAFTIVELLVVVTLIVALLAVLMPSLRMAIATSQSAVCLSQERQLGVAFTSYLSDNYNKYPPRGVTTSSNSNLFWLGELNPYYSKTAILLCPAADKPRPPNTRYTTYGSAAYFWGNKPGTWIGAYVGSYGFNGYLYGTTGSNAELWSSSFGGSLAAFANSLSRTTKPSNTPLFIDSAWCEVWPAAGNALGPLPASPDDPYYNYCYLGGAAPSYIARTALNRHPRRNTNEVALDLSARSIDLSAVWQLNWSRTFTTKTVVVP